MVTHAVRTWWGARRERAERDAELIDLVRISVRDLFEQHRLTRQLDDLAEQIAKRMRPIYEGARGHRDAEGRRYRAR